MEHDDSGFVTADQPFGMSPPHEVDILAVSQSLVEAVQITQ
jgi:hypothetical protein